MFSKGSFSSAGRLANLRMVRLDIYRVVKSVTFAASFGEGVQLFISGSSLHVATEQPSRLASLSRWESKGRKHCLLIGTYWMPCTLKLVELTKTDQPARISRSLGWEIDLGAVKKHSCDLKPHNFLLCLYHGLVISSNGFFLGHSWALSKVLDHIEHWALNVWGLKVGSQIKSSLQIKSKKLSISSSILI